MANIFKAKSLISRTGVFSNEVIAPNLVYNTGEQFVSGLKKFDTRPTVNGTGVLLSGEAASLPVTIVYTTGNQTISGTKTFANNLEVQGTGIFNALDLSNISEFNFSGTNINLISGNVNISGQIYISGNPVLTGVNLSSYATTANLASTGSTLATNLASTGSTLVSSINSLSGLFTGYTGDLDSTFATDIQLQNTGSTLSQNINSLSGTLTNDYYLKSNPSGFITGVDLSSYLTSSTASSTYATITNLASTGSTLVTNLASTGSTLVGSITLLSGLFTGFTGNLDATFASDTQLASTGSSLQTNINNLSGVAVLTFGNQTIQGVKTFTSGATISGPISGMYGTGDFLNALDVRGFASVGAELSSLTGIFGTGNVNLSGFSPGQFSAGNLLIGQNDGGAYIGRTNIRENSWQIVTDTIGSNWITGDIIKPWFNLSLSSDGRIQTAAAYDAYGDHTGQLYVSNDYGLNWTSKVSPTGEGWVNVVMSSDGKIQSATRTTDTDKTYISYDYGNTWIKNDSLNSLDPSSIAAMSSDGRIQLSIGLNVYISYDYGRKWNIHPSAEFGFATGPYRAAMSSDGKIQIMVGGDGCLGVCDSDSVYISYNYGLNWKRINNAGYGIFTDVAMSADGRIIITTHINGPVLISYNYGVSWSSISFDFSSIRGLSISSDGKIIAVGGTLSGTDGAVFLSKDYGKTWYQHFEGPEAIFSVKMSSDGRIITAVGMNGKIYISYATTVSPNPISVLGDIQASGQIYISGNPVLTGIDLSSYATTSNLALTGLNLSNNINSLSGLFTGYTGSLDATFASDVQLANTGSTLVNSIGSLSGTLTSTYATITNLASTGSTLSTNLASTGSTLDNKIGSLSGTLTSTYATITNLASTGSTLNSNIISLSGLFTGFTGNLDATYATDIQLFNTGSTLDNKINSLSGVSVLTYGNQNISGTKNFIDNVNFSGTGTFNAIDLNNIDNLSLSGVDVTLTDSIINVNRNIFISGNPVLTGVNLTPYATTVNLALTGLNLSNNISSLSGLFTGFTGNLDATFASDIQLANTGSTLVNSINSLSGLFTGFTGSLDASFATDTQLANTGSTIVNSISSLSGTLTSTYATINNLASTGSTLQSNINSLSGYVNSTSSNIVFTTGNQNIGGNKTFTGVTTFSGQQVNIIDTALNLSGLGDMTFEGTNINFINSPVFISGTNLRVSGTVLANNLNNLAYTTGNQNISGIKTFNVAPIVSGNPLITGDLSLYATTTDLASTGSTLATSINSLSGLFTGFTGALDATFASDIQLASTGSNLDTKINDLSGYINSTGSNIVFTTGNQTISGVKTFVQDATFGDTGQGDFLVISGNNFTVYGSGNFTSGLFVNSNSVLTGIDLSPYATIVNLASTGSNLNTQIENAKKLAIAYAIAL